MKVLVDVEEVELVGDSGGEIPGLCLACRRCGFAAEVFGTSDRSVRRGLVMLRDGCPEGERNWYQDDRDE